MTVCAISPSVPASTHALLDDEAASADGTALRVEPIAGSGAEREGDRLVIPAGGLLAG